MNVSLGTGFFSGLNTDELIKGLLSIESQRIERVQAQKTIYESKIEAYGTLSGMLGDLRSRILALKEASTAALSAASSDPTIFSASAVSTASAGVHTVNVSNIAQAQNIYSGSYTTADDAVADLTAQASQTLQIQVGSGESASITVNSTNNTLSGIRDAINAATDDVRASIVNDGTGYRLVLRSNSTGASNRITVKADEDNDSTFSEAGTESDATGLSALAFNATYDADGATTGGILNMTQSQAGINAAFTVDGLAITKASNTVTDVIAGVTLNLLSGSGGNDLTLTVSTDQEAMSGKVSAFAEAYNQVMGLTRTLSVASADRDVLLRGDGTSRSLMNGLRSLMSRTYEGRSAVELGLTHDVDGVLQFDPATFAEALEDDFDGAVASLDAMAEDFQTSVEGYIDRIIPARTNGLKTSISSLEDRIESLEFRLGKKEEVYRRQFAALEEILGKLQQDGDFLTQQLSKISDITSQKK